MNEILSDDTKYKIFILEQRVEELLTTNQELLNEVEKLKYDARKRELYIDDLRSNNDKYIDDNTQLKHILKMINERIELALER